MKVPRFFLGVVVLFWGWQVNLLWIAVFLALILESARLSRIKFEFKPSDVNKFVDISIVLLAGAVLIALTREPENAILIILKWLPLIFFPIIGAQEFSASGRIDVQSFFIATRKRVRSIGHEIREIDISLGYSFFCLVSAGTANTGGHLFYICVVAFFAWALYPVRSRRSSLMVWFICLVIVIGAGVAGHTGIHAFRKKVSRWVMAYYMGYYQADPFKAFTALGDIGSLKLSDKIVLRVWARDYHPGKTHLLHTATYNKFYVSNWSVRSRFESISPGSDETSWQINPPDKNHLDKNGQQMIVYSRPIKKRAVLSLPAGVTIIEDLKAGFCEKNEMQVVRVDDMPALIKAKVSFTGKLSFDLKPYAHDLMIPEKELPPIVNISKTLALENKSPEEILAALKDYFLNQYTYSLEMKGKGNQDTPLVNFFTHTRAGHCEFFATATALILRHAGIPARYATGFIAHEYSWMENMVVVRQRDAHAWVKVYINGQWENFDTTPPAFLELDRRESSSSLVLDFFSFIGFKLSQLRHETGARLMERYGLWLTLPLGVILFFRLRKSNKIKRAVKSQTEVEDQQIKNRATGFYLIEEMMSQKGFPRHPHETYPSWLDRIGNHFDMDGTGEPDGPYDTGETGNSGIGDKPLSTRHQVQALLQTHNQWRFSKSGLQDTEREKFDLDVSALLIKMGKTIDPSN